MDERSFLSEEKIFYRHKCHARVSTSINSVFWYFFFFFRSKDTSKVLIVWSLDLSFCRSNIIYYFYRRERKKVKEKSYSFFFFFLSLSKKRRKARPNKRKITDRRAKHRCYSQAIIYIRSSSRLILVNPCQLFSRKRRRRDHREGWTVLPGLINVT